MANNNGGRRQLPDVLKVVHGTDQPSRMNPDQPEYKNDSMQVPDHFDDEQRVAWFEIVPKLIRAGVAKDIDVFMLEQAVDYWVLFQEAHRQVKDSGLVVAAPSGYPMMNPYYNQMMQLGKELRMVMTEFGMSAASRQKITAEQEAPEGRFDKLNRK